MPAAKAKCIGILTSGGDCPGLNAAIRGVAKPAMSDFHIEVIGIDKGFRGLVENHARVLQFLFVMSFAQNVETVRSRDPGQRHQFRLLECRDNQENGIGMVCPGLHDLEFIDNEILAQAGKRTAGRNLAEILQGALKELFVGQHR